MTKIEYETINGSLSAHRKVNSYIERLGQECPALPEPTLRTWSISATDAVVIHEILDSFSEPVDVLDIGTFLGVSAFLFASHANVRAVVTVDPNPTVADEINDKEAELAAHVDAASLEVARVQDVAKAALNSFPDAEAKITFFEGVVSEPLGSGEEGTSLARLDIATLLGSGSGSPLVVLVDGLHSAEGVYGDLEAVLLVRPDAIVLLDDCRYYWGPFVQSGVSRFLEENAGRFHFRLLADLSHSLASSQLAVLYESEDGSLPVVVGRVISSLSATLDPLLILEREQEVVASSSAAFERDAVEAEIRREQSALQSLEDEVSYLRRLSARSHHQVAGYTNQLVALSQQLQAAQADLAALQASRSWRLTKRLRRAGTFARRLK